MSGNQTLPSADLLTACRALARAVDLFEEAACGVLGVGRNDLRALNLLEHGPLGPSALADALGLSRAAVTALLDRLEAAGYVARTAAPGDRRAVHVHLQPGTWAAFARVYRPLGDRVRSVGDDLSEHDRRVAAAVLESLADTVDAVRGELEARPG
ncbi:MULTISPECIES: MarR family winged helix-turn-helix transcriptional regulator [unclassified Geodermatophilus]